jgi:transcriptional regulator with XRE-family HTH domain
MNHSSGQTADTTPIGYSQAASIMGNRIKAARTKRGITQSQLAIAVGLDSASIEAFEAGLSLPDLPSLIRLAAALRCPVADLVDDLEPEHFTNPVAEQSITCPQHPIIR